MPYIIRNTAGEICGHCTNRPGEGNLLPDGEPERVEFYEDGDAPKELATFLAAQAAKPAAPTTVAQKLAAIGLTVSDLKAELAK